MPIPALGMSTSSGGKPRLWQCGLRLELPGILAPGSFFAPLRGWSNCGKIAVLQVLLTIAAICSR